MQGAASSVILATVSDPSRRNDRSKSSRRKVVSFLETVVSDEISFDRPDPSTVQDLFYSPFDYRRFRAERAHTDRVTANTNGGNPRIVYRPPNRSQNVHRRTATTTILSTWISPASSDAKQLQEGNHADDLDFVRRHSSGRAIALGASTIRTSGKSSPIFSGPQRLALSGA